MAATARRRSRLGPRPTGSAPACWSPSRTANGSTIASGGEPATWFERSGAPTWWTWSHEWLLLKWPQWSGHSRRSGVETLTLLAPLLVRDGAPKPPEGLADWLRRVGFRPNATLEGPAAGWLERWSIPLGEIDPAHIEKALNVVCAKADGGAGSSVLSCEQQSGASC